MLFMLNTDKLIINYINFNEQVTQLLIGLYLNLLILTRLLICVDPYNSFKRVVSCQSI